jgi:alanyl-tRNA synthetase
VTLLITQTTRLLYLETPELLECDVQVVKCEPHAEGAALILRETPFYPEGGGQPSDTGWIGGLEVRMVIENEAAEILHLVTAPLAPGLYTAKVNRDRRLDHMQQHAGQHLISALLLEHCNAMTIGFHMSETYTSIDLDQKLDKAQLDHVVTLANEAIRNSVPIETLYPDKMELQAMPLRKMPKVENNIRVIKIGDLDYSPCGGTHPDNTAGIGLVMITKAENYKSGTRIEFLAGHRAVMDYNRKNTDLVILSQKLATPVSDIVTSIEKLMETQARLEKELRMAGEILLEREAADLAAQLNAATDRYLVKTYEGRDMNALRTLAAAALKKTERAALILASVSQNQVQVMCARSGDLSHIDIREVFKAAITPLEGRGGGNPAAAQGGGSNVDQLPEALQAAESILVRLMTQPQDA